MHAPSDPGPPSNADGGAARKPENENEGGRPPQEGKPSPGLTTGGSAAEVSSSSVPRKQTLFQRFASNFWKEAWDLIKYTSPAALALFLGPLVIQQSFERERQASRADLSIEYAFLTDARSQSQRIAEIVEIAAYQEFVMRNYQSDLRLYVTEDGYYSRSRQNALDAAAARYKDHLMAKRDTFSAYLASLPALPQQELTALAYRYLDSVVGDKNEIHSQLEKRLNEEVERVGRSLVLIDELVKTNESSRRTVIMKLTVLNRGATDGLVRHEGKIAYRNGADQIIRRSKPPDTNAPALAVPTFDTSRPSDDYPSQSVGKVEKDSMTEFWYSFEPQDQAAPLCLSNEYLDIILYDHEERQVKGRRAGKVTCNSEVDYATR